MTASVPSTGLAMVPALFVTVTVNFALLSAPVVVAGVV
jgi:hypothetical protein